MDIGDWTITEIKRQELVKFPDNIDSPIDFMISYDFLHRPTGFKLSRSITFINEVSNVLDPSRVTDFLTSHVAQMKSEIVDVIFH